MKQVFLFAAKIKRRKSRNKLKQTKQIESSFFECFIAFICKILNKIIDKKTQNYEQLNTIKFHLKYIIF